MDEKKAKDLYHEHVGGFPTTEFYPALLFLDWLYKSGYEIVKKQRRKK